MSNIQEWNQADVVEKVRAEVQSNMEIAAKVVEEDARKNLLRIREPEWGRRYRRLLAFFRLTSIVESTANYIEALIGMPATTGKDLGFWIEIGTRTEPPHPWLRPALINNLRNILRIVSGR